MEENIKKWDELEHLMSIMGLDTDEHIIDALNNVKHRFIHTVDPDSTVVADAGTSADEGPVLSSRDTTEPLPKKVISKRIMKKVVKPILPVDIIV